MGHLRMWCILVAVLAVPPGCATVDLHPEVPPTLNIPCCCRNRVYVFLMEDLHPCHHSLEPLREKLIAAGFIKVYCGKRGHLGYFTKELKKICHADPEARFVIVGQGLAEAAACTLAGAARECGAGVDAFVFLDHPGSGTAVPAQQVIAIHDDARAGKPSFVQQSYCLTDTGCKGTASHPQTLTLLLDLLGGIAWQVPIIEYAPGSEPATLPAPTPTNRLPAPRPLDSRPRDEWDFLKPDGNDTGFPGQPPFRLVPGTPPATMRERR